MASATTAATNIDAPFWNTGIDLALFRFDTKGEAKRAPVLPTYEQATGIKDHSRLPSHRPNSRYHPYKRPTEPVSEEEIAMTRYLNTLFDDRCVVLDVAPAIPGRRIPPLVPHSNDEHAVNAQDLARALEAVVEYNRRRQDIAMFFLAEFVEGLVRARGRQQ